VLVLDLHTYHFTNIDSDIDIAIFSKCRINIEIEILISNHH